jgi:hypothetical protein
MEITSVKGEEQDEIEKILDEISKSGTVSKGKLDKYILELTEFSKDELEWKKVDVEYSVAYASSASTANLGALALIISLLTFALASDAVVRLVLPLLVFFPFSVNYFTLGKDGGKRNNQLYVLKKALIGK